MKNLIKALLLLSIVTPAFATSHYEDCHHYKDSDWFFQGYASCLKVEDLKAIISRTEVNGRADFFLVIGGASLTSDWVVRYASVDVDGFTQLKSASFTEVKIKEYDGPPLVKHYVVVGEQDGKETDLFGNRDVPDTLYFLVPKGTVKSEYNVEVGR